MKLIKYLIPILFLVIPSFVSAAWTATDNFDSYTTGTSIDGDSGGSGWNGNWSLLLGTAQTNLVTGCASGGYGGNALQVFSNAVTNTSVTRAVTSIGSGTFYTAFCTNSTAARMDIVELRTSLVGRLGVTLNTTAAGDVDCTDEASYQTKVGTFTTGAWHYIKVVFDIAGTQTFTVGIDGGAQSANCATNSNLAADTFRTDFFSGTGSLSYYIDTIGPTAPAAPFTFRFSQWFDLF